MKIFLTSATENYLNRITAIKEIYDNITKLGHIHSNPYVERFFLKESSNNYNVDQKVRHSIQQSDLLLAEISVPAFGVGYNIAIAKYYEIPILCLYRKDYKRNVPSFIKSSCSNLVHLVEYTNSNINEILESSINSSIPKRARFNMNLSRQANIDLKYIARKTNLSRTELIHKLIAKEMEKHDNTDNNFVI